MIKKVKQRLNTLIGTASGFKGVIAINLIIIMLVAGLMFLQRNWITREKKELKSMIEKQSISKKNLKTNTLKVPKKTIIPPGEKKNTDGISNNSYSFGGKITKENIKHVIKEADMYFDYDQHKKAISVYERLINSKIAIDKSDRVYSRLAESYYKLGEYEKALEVYRKVSNNYVHSPYRLKAQLGMGECLILTGDYGKARRVLYSITGLEAKYTEDNDKHMVIKAYYKIAHSYVEQAKQYLKEEEARQKAVVVR
ncbi:MAG: tol-pal system YbgF family protein [Candidatus Scalindua sp.]